MTKCDGLGCKIKERCLRFTSPAHNIHQWWTTPLSPVNEPNDCKMFIIGMEVKEVKAGCSGCIFEEENPYVEPCKSCKCGDYEPAE